VNLDLDCHLAGIALGDALAFTRWVAAAEGPIRGSLCKFAARVDVEVVVQETLLRMWQVAPRVVRDGQANALLRLALRTARNLAIDDLRRSRRQVYRDDDAPLNESVAALEPDPKLRENIVRCNEALPDKPSQALRARLDSGGGDPDDVLAARLCMRLNTFHQNLARARKLLAECLRRVGVELPEGALP
jgi:DNA-directed RNA polymerase specialized sigma24 family protein